MHVRRGLADAPWMDDDLPPVGFPRTAGAAPALAGLPVAGSADASFQGVAEGVSAAPVDGRAHCGTCSRATVFGNCADPVASGLATQFMLVAHPEQGKGCGAYLPVQPQGVAHVRVTDPRGATDWAFCPPLSASELQARFSDASRIEALDAADWIDPS